jgi:bifunctional ADP-heptose synthase (sugar kinase/adenylyltransferase)
LLLSPFMDTRAKIINLEQARDLAAAARARGAKVVLVDGCFDVLQAAHAHFIAGLRSDGAVVLVAVYDDASLCRRTEQSRPILGERARAALVAGLGVVDHVVLWRSPEIESLAAEIHPDRAEHAPDARNIIGEILERHK